MSIYERMKLLEGAPGVEFQEVMDENLNLISQIPESLRFKDVDMDHKDYGEDESYDISKKNVTQLSKPENVTL